MIEEVILTIKDGELKLHFGMWSKKVFSELMEPFYEDLKNKSGDGDEVKAKNALSKFSQKWLTAIIISGVENARILDGNFQSLKDEYADTKTEKNKLEKVVAKWVSEAGGEESQQILNMVNKFYHFNKDLGEAKAETKPHKKTYRGKK